MSKQSTSTLSGHRVGLDHLRQTATRNRPPVSLEPEPSGAPTLVLDNYDSFTYNLVQYLGELGCRSEVYRNDKISLAQIGRMQPRRILISPGPGVPSEAGITLALIREFAATIPILGVCLGHQAIGEAFGGSVVRAPRLLHGKTSLIYHNSDPIFADIPTPFSATRYHSLIVKRSSFPDCLKILAESKDGLIMACRHRELPVIGLQFHPESILTESGHQILKNFLCLSQQR